jgi:hypothetical protein
MKRLLRHRYLNSAAGFSLPMVLGLAMLLSGVGLAAASVTISNLRFSMHEQRSESALQIAEAGINYYLWHLAHNPSDYKDGGSTPASPPYGPYVHNYTDANGKVIGTYTLTITPPANGSTITTVRSVGQVSGLRGSRTILAQLGQPSFSNYIFLTDTNMIFSPTSTTTGPVHSNGGIEFNGTNNGPVTSAQSTYNNGSGNHPGVWGTGGPQSQWSYPVPAIDFDRVTADFSVLRTLSQNGGVYLNTSGGLGWNLRLRTDGTIDIYRVNNETATGITTTFIRNQAAPSNGVIFSSEDVWISGTGFTGRLTVAAARLPDSASTRRTITITNNLTYANQSGSHVIGLIAQEDIFIPGYAPSTMQVDAALLAQFGSVGYDTRDPNDGGQGQLETSFTLYGSIAQNQNDYGFKVTGCGSYCRGFPTTNYGFDTHLVYAPPPSFPVTGTYSVLNWRELLFNP